MANTVCAGAIIAPSPNLILLRELTPVIQADLTSVLTDSPVVPDDRIPIQRQSDDAGSNKPSKSIFHAFATDKIEQALPNFNLEHFTNVQTQDERIKYVAAMKLSLADILKTDVSVYFHKQMIRNLGKNIHLYTAILYCRKLWSKDS